MPIIYVARSNGLSKWAGDVGLTKHLFKVGVTEGKVGDAIKGLCAARIAGETDWRLVAKQEVAAVVEDEILVKIAVREMRVDPTYYPKLKGTLGIFKVKLAHVEDRILMKQAYAQEALKLTTPKPPDIGEYLIGLAVGEAGTGATDGGQNA